MATGSYQQPSDPLVFIIILNWNNPRDTAACIASAEGLDYSNFSIVVVDNGSTDGSADYLGKRHPGVKILSTGRNLGYAGGNNTGIRYARQHRAEYLWLLNNDTVVASKALQELIDVAGSDPRIGAVGSVLFDMDTPGQIQIWGGGDVNFLTGLAHHHQQRVTDDKLGYLSGASLLLKTQALEAIGLLDERFFLYWEDTDLCYRLRAAKWKLTVCETARVYHRWGGTLNVESPVYDYHYTASTARFFFKHAPVACIPVAVSTGGRILRRVARRAWDNVADVWYGFKAALRQHNGKYRAEKRVEPWGR